MIGGIILIVAGVLLIELGAGYWRRVSGSLNRCIARDTALPPTKIPLGTATRFG
jgi:hypothetical protein